MIYRLILLSVIVFIVLPVFSDAFFKKVYIYLLDKAGVVTIQKDIVSQK